MKIKIAFLCICIASILGACHDDDETKPSVAKTVFMYLVADNDISDDIHANIASVEAGLKNVSSPGTFVIYWDGGSYYSSEFPVPTLFKYEVTGKGKVSKRTIIQTYDEQNSVSPAVMLKVFNDMKHLCPADRYGLIFGSHATGWLPANPKPRSFGDDAGSKINIPELADVLSQTDIHFDYILMDACLMSQVEVAYELRNAADYLILSPAEVLSIGFPYMNITKDLMSTDDKKAGAIKVAEGFLDYYRNEAPTNWHWATIAVVKSDEMPALAAMTRSIMVEHQDELAALDARTLQNSYGYSRGNILGYSSYDFRAFMRVLTKQNTLPTFEEQLNKTIVYKGYVDDDPLDYINITQDDYSGIGCYVPYKTYGNWNNYFKSLKWYTAAGWSDIVW